MKGKFIQRRYNAHRMHQREPTLTAPARVGAYRSAPALWEKLSNAWDMGLSEERTVIAGLAVT